ncbi:MAG: acyl-CoA thioesterase [Candidatus Nanopelagicales bacterium]
MVASVPELLALLDLERVDDDILRGSAPTTTLQRVFGGQVLAQALVAGARTVPDDRAPHSLHGYFLRPGDPAVPIVYVVERTRDGGSFTTRRVVARQHGRPIFHMTASFQVAEPGFEHQDPLPEVPSPEGLETLAERIARSGREVSPDEWGVLDVRYAVEEPDRFAVWLRAIDHLSDDPLMHAAALAYASDLTLLGTALRPHGVGFEHPGLITASIDHAMWFHRPGRVDGWLLYDQDTPSASGGRGLARGRIFSRDGALVATTVQEGLMRLRRPDPAL